MSEEFEVNHTKLKKLSATKLKEVAEKLSVDIEGTEGNSAAETKTNILNMFAEFGIDDETYEKFYLSEEEKLQAIDSEVKPTISKENYKAGGNTVLKLIGKNPVYETYGFRFSRDTPFVAMSDDDAQQILDSSDGNKFKIASPREVKEFYGL